MWVNERGHKTYGGVQNKRRRGRKRSLTTVVPHRDGVWESSGAEMTENKGNKPKEKVELMKRGKKGQLTLL